MVIMASRSGTTATPSTVPRQPKRGTNPIIYLLVIILVAALIAIAYYAFVSPNNHANGAFNFSNTTGLNATESMYMSDLANATLSGAVAVTYVSGPSSPQTIVESPNLTVKETTTQVITSYALGSDIKSVYLGNITYMDAASGKVLDWNTSTLYYYNTTSGTVTCQLSTTMGMPVNSSPYCMGGVGAAFLTSFPFTLKNLSYMGYLAVDNAILLGNVSVSYDGVRSYAGRRCDNFIVSNETSSLLSSYNTFDVCIESGLGLPLYFNETDILNGVVNDTSYLQAVNVSTNVSGAEFTIPASFIGSAS